MGSPSGLNVWANILPLPPYGSKEEASLSFSYSLLRLLEVWG